MIKFKKGSLIPKSAPVLPESTVAPVISASASPSSSSVQWKSDQVINLEWWQTPDKFKRRNVEELECDLINVTFITNLFISISKYVYLLFTEWRS